MRPPRIARRLIRCWESSAAQSMWKKSVASMVAAWECRNRRQVVSMRRLGAGGIRSALRTRRIVSALAGWPCAVRAQSAARYDCPDRAQAGRLSVRLR